MTNQLNETFQSTHKEFHSTETALLRVQNDILCSLDQNKSVILLLLDLSAAFDTVDHAILIPRLWNRFGVKETTFAWFKSYLTSRQQFVKVEEDMSSKRPLRPGASGVSTGPTAVPYLYYADCWYHQKAQLTIPSVCWWHATIYISFNTDCCADLDEAKLRVERCV